MTTTPKEHAALARQQLSRAEAVGARTSGRAARPTRRGEGAPGREGAAGPKLGHRSATRQEIKLTVMAAEHFRIAGEHFDSGKAYSIAAALCAEDLQDPRRAAELFTEAAIVMEKLDSDFANEYYRKAISQHCDASQYNEAAILEERMANNHRGKKHFDASIKDYDRASKLYAAANAHDGADRARGSAAYLLGVVGRVRDSARCYQRQAKSQANQNMKKFNVPRVALRAGVLLLSHHLRESQELDFSEVREMAEEMYEIDCRFAESPEHDFLVDMMQCVARGDLDKFADSLFSASPVFGFDDLMLDALEVIKNAVARGASKDPVKMQYSQQNH